MVESLTPIGEAREGMNDLTAYSVSYGDPAAWRGQSFPLMRFDFEGENEIAYAGHS